MWLIENNIFKQHSVHPAGAGKMEPLLNAETELCMQGLILHEFKMIVSTIWGFTVFVNSSMVEQAYILGPDGVRKLNVSHEAFTE